MNNTYKCEYCNCELNNVENIVMDMDMYEPMIVCDKCLKANRNIFYCYLHKRFEIDTEDGYFTVYNYGKICSVAYEDYIGDEIFPCDGCGELFHRNDVNFEDDGCWYCDECFGEFCGLPQYHTHSYDEFLDMDSEITNQYYGIELEIEVNDDNRPKTVVSNIQSIIEKEFYVERDGSLNNGFEIISKPFSYNYLVNNLENTLENLCKNLQEDIDEDANTNGMHIHITRQNFKHMFRMVCLVEYFQRELTILSNRSGVQLRRWASFLTDKDDKELLSARMLADKMFDATRYSACNIENQNTIEIRIFKATNDVKEILGRIELVHNISEFAKENKLEDDFSNMPSFLEIATYKESRYVDYILSKYNLVDVATC